MLHVWVPSSVAYVTEYVSRVEGVLTLSLPYMTEISVVIRQ